MQPINRSSMGISSTNKVGGSSVFRRSSTVVGGNKLIRSTGKPLPFSRNSSLKKASPFSGDSFFGKSGMLHRKALRQKFLKATHRIEGSNKIMGWKDRVAIVDKELPSKFKSHISEREMRMWMRDRRREMYKAKDPNEKLALKRKLNYVQKVTRTTPLR